MDNMQQNLTTMFKTVDQFGQLMPSFLQTPTSDLAKELGWVEDCIGEGTSLRWERLTEAGKKAKESFLKKEGQ